MIVRSIQLCRPVLRRTANVDHRQVHSRLSRAQSNRPPRVYRYAIDVHGQLFLYDTKPKNLTSCYKSSEFLNFFLTRIRPNDAAAPAESEIAPLEEEWTERGDLTLDDALCFGRAQGYHWLSPCQGEQNLVRSSDSPIVFRELSEQGVLTWAGDLTCQFQPSALRVDPETGYVYHPSPEPPLASLRKRAEIGPAHHPYGAFSLLSSALVLQRLASGLDLDPDTFAEGKGGSVEWQGKRYEMGLLKADDLAFDRRYRVDDLTR